MQQFKSEVGDTLYVKNEKAINSNTAKNTKKNINKMTKYNKS